MKTKELTNRELELVLIEGPEGMAVCLNNYRIAGPKPWGGGKLCKAWCVKIDDIIKAITDP